jgi:2-dehydropantoate 2-reductase
MAALAKASDADLGPGIVDGCMATLDALGANGYSSLHYDLTHGKRLEIDALQGYAVKLGERYGIPTPMLFAVYAALRPYLEGPPEAITT